MPWIVVTMISLIYNVIEVVGIIILPPMVAQAAPNLLYIFATEATGYFGLVGLTIYIYIFIVVWSFRKQLLESVKGKQLLESLCKDPVGKV